MSLDIDNPEASLIEAGDSRRPEKRILRQEKKRYLINWPFWLNCSFAFFNLFFFAVLVKDTVNTTSSSECEPPLIYSPARDAVRPELRFIHVELDTENEYNGQPNPSNDAAWMRLFKNANIRLKPHELEGTNRTSIDLADGSGDLYGTLDIYHQLHCIKYIREYIHPEYYNLKPTPVPNIDHADHCIDMLRQLVMCRGDIALTTYKWIPDYPLPWPDFGLAHECRSWESIDQWASERAIDVNDYSLIVHPQLGPAFLEADWNRTKHGG